MEQIRPKNSQVSLVPDFSKKILEFIKPSRNSSFNVCSLVGLNYLTKLHAGLSHPLEHGFC